MTQPGFDIKYEVSYEQRDELVQTLRQMADDIVSGKLIPMGGRLLIETRYGDSGEFDFLDLKTRPRLEMAVDVSSTLHFRNK